MGTENLNTELRSSQFQSIQEKQEYIETILQKRILFPVMDGGMGIDFTNEQLALAVMQEGGLGVISASLVGYNDINDQKLEELDFKMRINKSHKANKEALLRKIKLIREQSPYGLLGVNIMKAVSDYESLVQVIGETNDVDFIFVGAGIARDLPKTMQKYPKTHYVPIVSSVRAAKIILKQSQSKNERKPAAWYVELPQFAGGHLGAKNVDDANDFAKFEAKKIRQELAKLDSSIPVILAGGIMYAKDTQQAFQNGYDGISSGTRMLLTQESGLSNHLIEEYYLNHQYSIVEGMTSPAGLPSRYIDNGFLKKAVSPERLYSSKRELVDIAQYTRERCVSCIGSKNCAFLKGKTPYCITHWLSKTTRGEKDGLLFTGSELRSIRNDPIYIGENGEIYIPTVKEAVDILLNKAV